jgi:hypothetical protein
MISKENLTPVPTWRNTLQNAKCDKKSNDPSGMRHDPATVCLSARSTAARFVTIHANPGDEAV